MNPITPEYQAIAAEYALGLLDVADMARAEARSAANPEFAAEVERWRRHFSGFDRTTPMATLPPDLWSRIEAKLDDAPATIAPAPTPAAVPAPRAGTVADAKPGLIDWLWNNLNVWRIGGFAAVAAAIMITIGLSAQLREARSAPVLVAILQTPDNQTAAIVNAFADGRTELVPLTTFTVPAGKVLEVWTLWDRQVGPRSVGLLQAMSSSRLKLDNLPLGANQLFEITLEPEGGSPIGRPTGPILAIGRTAQRI